MIKMIDPTGRVVGRARAADPWHLPSLDTDEAFANDGKIFKEVFAARARTLVNSCLTELGPFR